MRKAIFILLIAVLIFIASPSVTAFSEDDLEQQLQEEVEKKTDSLDLSELERFCAELENSFFDTSDVKALIKSVTAGEFVTNPKAIFDKVGKMLLSGFTDVLPAIISVVMVAVLFSMMFGLTGSFVSKQTTEIVYFACYSAVILIVMTKVVQATLEAKEIITMLNGAFSAVLPPLITVVAALGGSASAAIYQPQLAFFSVFIVNVITYGVIPIYLAAVTFSLVGNLSSNVKLEKLAKACLFVNKCILTLTFGAFMLYITIAGITGGIIDTVSVKAAKFMVSSYVPILGGYLSQGFDLVAASLVLIKNSIGVIGMLVVIGIVLVPIVKLTALTLGLKLVAGIIEPITDKRMTDFVYGVSDCTGQLIAAVAGVGFSFMIMMLMMICTFNAGVV